MFVYQSSLSQTKHNSNDDKVVAKVMENKNFQSFFIAIYEISELYRKAVTQLSDDQYLLVANSFQKDGYYYTSGSDTTTTSLPNLMTKEDLLKHAKELADRIEQKNDSLLNIYNKLSVEDKQIYKNNTLKTYQKEEEYVYERDKKYMIEYLHISPHKVEDGLLKSQIGLVKLFDDMKEFNDIFKDTEKVTKIIEKSIDLYFNKIIKNKKLCLYKFNNSAKNEFYINVSTVHFNYLFFPNKLKKLIKYSISSAHLSFLGISENYRKCVKK